jgi:hypothetical protein
MVARKGYRSLIKSKIRFSCVKLDKKLWRDMYHSGRNFFRMYRGKTKRCKISEVERFVAHFMKILGSLTETNQSPDHANNVFPPIDPIVGPQLTSTIFPQFVLGKDLTGLNFPINIHEVTTVIRKVCNGKSTSDMMFMELFKNARGPKQKGGFSQEPLFAENLCKMFNRCFYDGEGVPNSWLKSYLIPIYKRKGSEFDTDNYRGVAVCSTLYRIYSGILNNRLDDFCEKHSLRGVTQRGFRKCNGTILEIFALSHAIHK